MDRVTTLNVIALSGFAAFRGNESGTAAPRKTLAEMHRYPALHLEVVPVVMVVDLCSRAASRLN